MTPGDAADHEQHDEAGDEQERRRDAPAARARSSRARRRSRPRSESEITRLAALKKVADSGGSPVANMWCTHTPKPRMPVLDRGERDAACSPTSGRRQKTGSDMRDDAHGRQHDDVDPRDGRRSRRDAARAAAGRRSPGRRNASRTAGRARGRCRPRVSAGSANSIGERSGQRSPHEDRHAVDRHARRAQREDRRR